MTPPQSRVMELAEEVIALHVHEHAHIYAGHSYQVCEVVGTLEEEGEGPVVLGA